MLCYLHRGAKVGERIRRDVRGGRGRRSREGFDPRGGSKKGDSSDSQRSVSLHRAR